MVVQQRFSRTFWVSSHCLSRLKRDWMAYLTFTKSSRKKSDLTLVRGNTILNISWSFFIKWVRCHQKWTASSFLWKGSVACQSRWAQWRPRRVRGVSHFWRNRLCAAPSPEWPNGIAFITLWWFDIAMGNDPFIDGLPIKHGDLPRLC